MHITRILPQKNDMLALINFFMSTGPTTLNKHNLCTRILSDPLKL